MQRVIYLGVFLTSKSITKLLKRVPAMHKNLHASHMTVLFKPDGWQSAVFPKGKKIRLLVTGVYHDHKGQAISVIPFGVKSLNENPHITISTADGVTARYSNELLANTKKKKWKLMLLEGVTDTYPSSRDRHHPL